MKQATDTEPLARLSIMIPVEYREALDLLKRRGYNPSEIIRMAIGKELRARKVLKD